MNSPITEEEVVNPIKDGEQGKSDGVRRASVTRLRKPVKEEEKPKRRKSALEDDTKGYTIQRSGEADSDDDDDDVPIAPTNRTQRASSVEELTLGIPVQSTFDVESSTLHKPSRRKSAHEESLAAAQTKFKGAYKKDDTFQHISPMHDL